MEFEHLMSSLSDYAMILDDVIYGPDAPEGQPDPAVKAMEAMLGPEFAAHMKAAKAQMN
jgi:hypothetical protein